LTFAISSVSLAALANIADERQRAISMMRGLAATCIITMPAFFGLSLISEDIVALVLPSHWSYSGQILSVTSIGGIALTLHSFGGAMLSVAQRANLNNLCSGSTAVLAIAAYSFAAGLGLLPMAWAVVFTGLATLPLRFYFIQRHAGVTWTEIFFAMAPGLCAGAFMYGITMLLDYTVLSDRSILSLTLTIGFGVTIYAACLRIMSKTQFNMLHDFILHFLPYHRWRRANIN
jgi:PST family polysaccharide transporter